MHNKLNNYLCHSQYLSGITEQSIEESIITQSFDYRNSKLNDDKSRHMLISKYSRSEDGGRDSVAFLYDKLKDNLDKDSSVDIARENQPSPSPFKENNCYFHSEGSVTCKSVYWKDTENSQKEYIVFTDEGDSVQSNKGFETVRNNNHYEELSDDSRKSQAKLTLGELANQHSNNINEWINYCNDKEFGKIL